MLVGDLIYNDDFLVNTNVAVFFSIAAEQTLPGTKRKLCSIREETGGVSHWLLSSI